MIPLPASRLPRALFQLLTAIAVSAASLPGRAVPTLGFDERPSGSGLAGSFQLFRLDDQGLRPLPDLMNLMAAMPASPPKGATSPQALALPPDSLTPPETDSVSDVTGSQLGAIEEGSLIALQDLGSSVQPIAQRPVPSRPTRPPAPVSPIPAPAPAPAPVPPLFNSAIWTVVIVAGVAVAVLVATNGPQPPVSR